jgi:hypothetical protein
MDKDVLEEEDASFYRVEVYRVTVGLNSPPCLIIPSITQQKPFKPDSGSMILLRKVGICLHNYKVAQSRMS